MDWGTGSPILSTPESVFELRARMAGGSHYPDAWFSQDAILTVHWRVKSSYEDRLWVVLRDADNKDIDSTFLPRAVVKNMRQAYLDKTKEREWLSL